MNNEFEIRILSNYTATEMYSVSSTDNVLHSIPCDAALEFLQGGNGVKIPVADTASAFSSQSYPTLCLLDDSGATSQWLAWSYFFTKSTSGAGAAEMTEYLLHQIHYTSGELPDSADTSTHYAQAVPIAKLCVLSSSLSNPTGLNLPAEFGVRAISVDVSGTITHQLEVIVIGDISTGVNQ